MLDPHTVSSGGRAALTLTLALALTAACGGASAPAPEAAARGAAAAGQRFAALAYVPADTPYAVAVLEAFPWDIFEQLVPGATDAMRAQAAAQARAIEDAEGDLLELGVGARLRRAYDTEIGVLDRDGMRRLGLGEGTRFVVYGLALFPAVRAEVADAAALRAAIERVLDRADIEPIVSQLEGHALLTVELDDAMVLVVGFPSAHEVVAGWFPAASAAPLTRSLLGIDRPARSLADSGRFAALLRDHRFSPGLVGFVDTRAVLDQLTGRATGVHAAAARFLDGDVRLDATCAADAYRLVAQVPELVAGYEQLDVRGMSMVVRAVLHPQLTEALRALRVSVPGLTDEPEGDPLIVVGAGLDLGATRALVETTRAALAAEPLRCAALQPLVRAVQRADDLFAQLPPLFDQLHGVQVTVDDLVIGAGPVTSVRVVAGAAVSVASPELLLQVGAQLLPGLAAARGATASAPAEVSLAMLGVPGLDAMSVAADAETVALAVGPAAAAAVPRILAGARPDDPPLLVVGYHLARVMRLTGVMRTLQDQPGAELMNALMARFGFATMSIHADPRGLAFRLAFRFD